MTKQRVDYHRYMASREWALKRKAVRARNGGDCERCDGGPITQVHHLSYAQLGNEPPEDLQGLCRSCHEYVSAVIDVDPVNVMTFEFYLGFDRGEYEERWGFNWQQDMARAYGEGWWAMLCKGLQHTGYRFHYEEEVSKRLAQGPVQPQCKRCYKVFPLLDIVSLVVGDAQWSFCIPVCTGCHEQIGWNVAEPYYGDDE